MTAMRLPLAVSTGFHALLLAALILAARQAVVPIPEPKNAFQIAMPPPMARLETVRPIQPPAEQVLKPVEPEAEPVVTATEPVVKARAEPERRVTAVEPRPRPLPRPRPRPRPVERQRPPPPVAALPPSPAPAPPARAAAPDPAVENGYKLALSRWFETHKRYPASARDAGEEGTAIVRFRVDRSGRVLSFSLAQSTGHPDLDRAVATLLRGAELPPFPAGLTVSSLDVAVALRFSLGQ